MTFDIQRKTATSRLSDFEVWKQAIAKLQAKEIDFSGDLDRYQNVFLAYMKLWAEYEMPEEIYCRQPEKPKAKEGKRLTDHDVKPLEYIRKTLKGPEEPEVPAEEEPSLQVTAVHPVQVEVETEEEKELELPAEWKDDVMVAHEAFSKGLIPYDVYMRPLVLLAKLAVVLQHKVANLGNQYHELRLKQLYSEKIHSILKQISTDRMRVQKLFLEAGIRQYAAQFEELEDMELKIKLDQEYYDLLMQLTWAHNAIRDRLASLMEQSKMERIESEPELAEKETADLEVPPVSTVASQQRSVLEPEKKHAVEELEKKKKPEPEEKKEKSTKAKQQWANVSQNIKKKKLVEKFRDQHLAKEHESMEKGARRVSVKKAADEPRKLSKERKELREPRQPSKELETLEEPKRRPKAQTVSEELRKQSKEPRRSAEQLQSLKVRRGSGAVLSKESVTSAERKHQLKKHKGSEVQVQLDDDLEESDTGESTILSSYTSVGIRSSTPLQSQVTSAVDVEDDADIDSGAFLERLQRWVPSPSFSRHGPSVDLTDAVPEVSMRAFSSQFAVAELQPLYEQRAVGQETYMPDSEDLNLYTIGCPSTLFNKSLLKPRSSGGSSIGRTSFDIRTSRGDIVPGQESVETGHFLGMTTPSQAVQGYWQMSDIKNLSVRGWSLEMEASSVRPSIAEQQKPQKELFDMDTDSLHSKDDKEGLIHSPEPPPRTDLLPLRHRISLEPDDISDKTLDILRDDKTRGYKKVDKKRGDKKGAPVLPGVRVKTRPVDLKACGAAIGVPRPERQWVVYKSRWDVSPPGTDPRKSTHSACREVADVRKYSMAGGSVATDGSVKIHLSKKELAKLVSPKQALEATHEPRHQPLGKVAKMVSPRQALEATHKPLHQPLGKVHPLDMDRTFNALVFKNCLGNCLENLPKAAALTKSEIQDTRSRIKQQLQRHSRGSKILTETDTSFDQESTTYDMEEEAVEFLEPEHQVRNEAVTSVCKWVCENEVEMEKRRNNVCTPLPKISKETTVRAAFNRLLPLPGSMMKSKRKQQVKVGSRRTSSAPMVSGPDVSILFSFQNSIQ
ncbi:hypothetical protein BaRGS_00000846 [Batillaria attramentaria]|uniref:Uncharacterized protein n=1 Tax=Batillaria attramentaria TaxID=370345 RepID=A0ABD0M8W4_9CAEN